MKNPELEKIIVIGGPTCVGKSDKAVDIALEYGGEVVSADSVQIYRGLDIGSGKITKDEMRGVPHHMIDIIDPYETFTVMDFAERAKKVITDIISRGKLPVVVGGTGFYINALIHGYDCGKAKPDPMLRRQLKLMEERNGKGFLYMLLKKLDPETSLSANDMPRIERKLERLLAPDRDMNEQPAGRDMYDALFVVMDADREKLDEKAARRISAMMDAGLMEEVERLLPYRNFPCMGSVGYKQCLTGLNSHMPRCDIEESMRVAYHGLIKKQQTFFRWIRWDNKIYARNWEMAEADRAIKEFINK